MFCLLLFSVCSCWAFSATEAIESQWLISGHSQALLAPQQIVDCDTTSYGCEGGWPSHAFEYIIGAGGQELESEYPYQAVTGSCSFDKTKVAATISSYMNVSADENQMAQVLYEKGPLSVALDAQVLQSYVSGIVQAFLCGKQLDHAVLITGFSVDNNLGVFKENVWYVLRHLCTLFPFYFVTSISAASTCGIGVPSPCPARCPTNKQSDVASCW